MILAVDTETTGTDFFHGCRPFMITACDGHTNYHWQAPVNPYTREVYWDSRDLEDAWDLISSANNVIFHNAKFDMMALQYIGLPMHTMWPKMEDTIIAAHCINAAHDTKESRDEKRKVGRSLGLKPLTLEYYGYPTDDETELEEAVKLARLNAPPEYRIARKGDPHFPGQRNQKWHKMDYWLCPEECLKYAYGDVERTYLLWAAFKFSLVYDGLWTVYQQRKKMVRHCYNMMVEGEDFNKEAAQQYILEIKTKKEELRQEVKRLTNTPWKLSLSKADHIASVLKASTNIPTKHYWYTDNGKFATDKHALDHYYEITKHPAIGMIKDWKVEDARERYINQYVNWVADDNCIHGSINPTGTRETRQSSDSPNQQNRTAVLDRFFVPKRGWIWMDADFENIEMRIWAYAVNNAELVQLFNEGKSYHMLVFDILFPQEAGAYRGVKDKLKSQMSPRELELAKLYRDIKAFNFGIIYGATEGKADETVGRKGSYNKLISKIPEIEEFTRKLTEQIYVNYEKFNIPCIYTLGGYRLPVPLDQPYKASNYYVQGSAGIITARAMDNIAEDEDYIASESKMYNQVHDSIRTKIRICNETEYLIDRFQRLMCKAGEDYIPSCGVTYNIITNPEDCWPF